MINQKRKKNKLSIYLFLIATIFIQTFTFADNIDCQKFDIKCKSKKWVNETKDFQKQKLSESKTQLNKSKEVIKKTLKKK